MKSIRIQLVLAIILLLGYYESYSQKTEQPNVVIIFVDDLGYGDLGCFGAKNIRTPNIDKLADEGIKFTDFYAQNHCSPSRDAILSGMYPFRSEKGLYKEDVVFAELFQEKAYKTACIGKWDVSGRKFIPGRMPNDQGFDYFWGTLGSNDIGVIDIYHNMEFERKFPDMSQLTRTYTDKAIDFIEENKDAPFLVYLAHSMVHTVIDASPDFKNRSGNGLFADVVEELDFETGRLVDFIAECGLEDNTLFIFTSDNGAWCNDQERQHRKQEAKFRNKTPVPWSKGPEVAWGSSGPLRAGKGSAYEGGSRVPCIMKWKGKIPAGKTSDALIASIDFFPTFASVASLDMPKNLDIDGVDQSELLVGKSKKGNREEYLYMQATSRRVVGICNEKWKLLLPDRKPETPHVYLKDFGTNDYELYDLSKDIGEKNNVIDKHPKIKQQLLQQMDAIINPKL
ncbi:MAG: sulfatase-like hydrolase/transferase [Bacteroidales bacterium]|nr:sulfatase-like hydrolase/transferase [Bacteroidales bacterium]